ncbi:response regulator transcription factor [Nocardioides sp. AX2bis]|uniref:response regulator transcription factor n=1 Tax=Nocardioides sp. AX2bis TaxID=2653157 RepID=UPI0012EFC869|nr:response regulator transcription factor [Nocardioides sp. AX2bis]VXB10665.1 Two component transcriptional regulator, LuxR family [Nocardioides sp. AX2bis]
MPVTVAVVDDHPLVLAGLGTVLAPYADRVRLLAGPLTYAAALGVDVVLHDPYTGPHRGAPDPRRVLGRPRARLVVFSWRSDADLVAQALAAGADGYLVKSCTAAELVDTVERVHAGEVVRPGDRSAAYDALPWPGAAHGLSVRESEVLSLVSRGLSNAEIAAHAFVSINTVKTYIRSAYRKIGATTRPQAVIWALGHGFGPTPSPWADGRTLRALPRDATATP